MKKVLDTEAEKLEGLVQDSEKEAVKDATKVFKEEEEKHEEKKLQEEDSLRKNAKGTFATYHRALATLLEGKMMGVELPEGWSFIVHPTDDGVILELTYGTRMFRSAFKPTFMEKYDLNAVNMYVVRAENTIDRVMERDTAYNNVPTK